MTPSPAHDSAHAADPTDLRATALRARTGDTTALTELVRATSPIVWRVCASLVDASSADDLTQDTFVRAVRSLPGYRGDDEPLRWLLTIARRVCAAEIVQRQRSRQAVQSQRRPGPPTAADPMTAVDLDDALARLPHHRREALILTALVGLTYAEAAAVCECPVGTIRSRVARARSDLYQALYPNSSDRHQTERHAG